MRNTLLIAKREYLERVRTKAFIISTIFIPVFFFGLMFVAAVMMKKESGHHHIAIVSSDTALAKLVKNELTAGSDGRNYTIDLLPESEDTHAELNAKIDAKQLDGYLLLSSAGSATQAPSGTYYTASASDLQMQVRLAGALRNAVMQQRLKSLNIPAAQLDVMLKPAEIDLQSIHMNEKSNSLVTIFGAIGLMMLLYMTVLLHGINVGRSVVEEKTSRVFEVMLSMIQPDDLLAGKILGVGGVGLTQIGIWFAGSGILVALGVGSAGNLSKLRDVMTQMPMAAFIAFVFCYVFGFIYFSALSAMLGAMVSSEQELQQMNMLAVMPLAGSMAFAYFVILHPDAWYSVVLSLFPPTAPIIMFLRISMHVPPWWQLWLCLGLMLAAIYAVVWLSSRIYRVGILMYGKRPNLPELLRWIRYS